MKILFIVTQSEFGGAQQFLSQLITVLNNKGKHNITIAAGPEGDDESGLLRLLEKRGINTRHLRYLRRAVNPIFDFCLGLIEIYRLIKKEKPDTLFLCSSKAGALGSLVGRLAGVSKIIYRIGGWTFNDPRPFLSRLFYKFIERISARWKDIIIVNAECHRKQAIELGIKPKGEILTIYNGIDFGKLDFLSQEEARRNMMQITNDMLIYESPSHISRLASDSHIGIIIGTIANLYPAKGLEYLIEAASMIRNKFVSIKFIVIGEGTERLKLKELIKKYNLEDSFFLVGAATSAYKYLKAFDIFVLSSVKEGFPWAILEAMAAEVPIVATKVGAIPEILENPSNSSGQTALLVEPGNANDLSKAILELLEDYSLRIRMAENAKKVVEEKFSLEKMVEEIEKYL